jgi:VWFA-related protein
MIGRAVFRVGMVGANLKELVIQVDGVEICRLTAPPLECHWDAGSRVAERVVRAVATTVDGRRLTTQVRTKGLRVTYGVQVDSVLISAHVTDGRGRFVPGLKAEDFRVLEDGVPQRVSLLDGGEAGAEVVVALDLSGSMAPAMEDLKVVVRDFLDRLRPIDRVTLAGFNNGFFILAGPDAGLDAKRQAIAEAAPSGTTAIYDTLISAAEHVGAHPSRRAVVVFTDGQDMSSLARPETARAALHAHDTVLYLVASGSANSDVDLRRRLTSLAVETGGAAFYAGRLRDTTEHFREIVQDLGRQYLLAFSPEKPLGDGKWRALQVTVANRSLRVRARTGYFATRAGR